MYGMGDLSRRWMRRAGVLFAPGGTLRGCLRGLCFFGLFVLFLCAILTWGFLLFFFRGETIPPRGRKWNSLPP